MYAIIETGGKQYRVQAGDKVKVEKLNAEVDSTIVLDKVLLVGGETTTIGTPVVEGATVEAKVLRQDKAKKVIVYKYKPKKGYHKKNGHRQLFTELRITSVSFGGVTETAEEKEETKEAPAEIVEETKEAAPETAEAVEETAAPAEETAEAAE